MIICYTDDHHARKDRAVRRVIHPLNPPSVQSEQTRRTIDTVNDHKIWYIKWRDAFTETDEWHSLESITTDEYTCETVGYLIKDNKKTNYYSIAGTVTAEGMYASIINIPKAMVITRKLIKVI